LFLLKKHMLNSSLETTLGNKKTYCFIYTTFNFYEPRRKRIEGIVEKLCERQI